jgi:putative endonuclease
MGRAKDAVGAYGERVAVAYLTAHGMELVDRNWRCAAGEIDIIMRDRDAIVFVEVKTRRSDAFGTPAEAIGYRKQARLRQLAVTWLGQSDQRYAEIRFDVVSVLPQRGGAARVEHLRAAF